MAVCASAPAVWAQGDAEELPPVALMISVAEQKLALLKDGGLAKKYAISTSKFGLGDTFNSYKTPLGRLRVCDKIGDNLAHGAVLKSRTATGEILPVNAPGRDPIVTRILWLEGLESGNANARSRGIYIHGTVEESKLGQPVSYGCIRMRSRDVVELFDEVPVGTPVLISEERFPRFRKPTPKTEVLLAANETVTMKSVGPHGQVLVRTLRRTASGVVEEKPAAVEPKTQRPAKAATKTPVELLAKKAPDKEPAAPAPAEPAPAPVDEGPTVILSTAKLALAKSAPAKRPTPTEAVSEPTIVFKLKDSILTAGLEAETKAPVRPESKPSTQAAPLVAPVEEPKYVTLAVAPAADFLATPSTQLLDLLSERLLNPPTANVRLAFRTQSLPRKL